MSQYFTFSLPRQTGRQTVGRTGQRSQVTTDCNLFIVHCKSLYKKSPSHPANRVKSQRQSHRVRSPVWSGLCSPPNDDRHEGGYRGRDSESLRLLQNTFTTPLFSLIMFFNFIFFPSSRFIKMLMTFLPLVVPPRRVAILSPQTSTQLHSRQLLILHLQSISSTTSMNTPKCSFLISFPFHCHQTNSHSVQVVLQSPPLRSRR